MPMNINLSPCSPADMPVLRNLMNLYLYDFSEMCGDDVGDGGFFEDEYLPRYESEPGRYAFLVRVDGKLAGFVLVRRVSEPEEEPPTHSIAEFFVMRKYRREGVGRYAAVHIFDRFPGKWQVAEIEENLNGIKFWRKIIAEYTGGQYEEVRNPHGEGPMQVFSSSK